MTPEDRAWHLATKIPVIALTGTGNVAHLNESLAALPIRLTPAQLQWLEDGRP